MHAVFLGLGLGLGVICVSFLFRFIQPRRLARRYSNLSLIPNCLLTTSPIVILKNQKPLWHCGLNMFDASESVAHFLREHGYQVSLMSVSSLTTPENFDALLSVLPNKCHFISEAKLDRHLITLSLLNHPLIASLTSVRYPSTLFNESPSTSPATLRPLPIKIETHTVATKRPNADPFHYETSVLKIVIEIAEREMRWSSASL